MGLKFPDIHKNGLFLNGFFQNLDSGIVSVTIKHPLSPGFFIVQAISKILEAISVLMKAICSKRACFAGCWSCEGSIWWTVREIGSLSKSHRSIWTLVFWADYWKHPLWSSVSRQRQDRCHLPTDKIAGLFPWLAKDGRELQREYFRQFLEICANDLKIWGIYDFFIYIALLAAKIHEGPSFIWYWFLKGISLCYFQLICPNNSIY